MADLLTPKYELTINGSAAPADLVSSIISITVRQDTDLSDAIEVLLWNPDLEWLDGDTLAEGTKISVKLGYVESDQFDTLASGKVARRECAFPERGPSTLLVIAYDAKQALKNGKKSKTWTSVKHSDVVSQICQGSGLQADVDDTQDTVPYVAQIAQTDLSFVRQLASLNGYQVMVDPDGTKLSFKKPDPSAAADNTLKWGLNLLSFRPRFSIHGQAQSASVRGWDSKAKQAIVGNSTTSDVATMGSKDVGAAVAQKKLGTQAESKTTQPVSDQNQADNAAKASMAAAMQNFAEADGSCPGTPTIQPGSVLEIDGVGARASGQYFVTSALHCLEPRGFTTFFRVKRPGSGSPPTPPPAPPSAPPAVAAADAPNWVEFVIVPDGVTLPDGTKYTITLPDGRQVTGTLDSSGKVRVDDVTSPGDCKIELDIPDSGGDAAPAAAGGDAAPADAGGDSAPADAGGDSAPADAGGDSAPADAGGDSAPADAGGDSAPADAGGDSGNAGGDAASATPTVAQIDPATSDPSGTTSVTITGTNLGQITSVVFGQDAPISVTPSSDGTSIPVTVTAAPTDSGAVPVVLKGDPSGDVQAGTFTFAAASTWTAAWSTTTAQDGSTAQMLLTAPGLAAGTQVTFEVTQDGIGSLGQVTANADDGKAQADWSDWFHGDLAVDALNGSTFKPATFSFKASTPAQSAQTTAPLTYADHMNVTIVDENGTPRANTPLQVASPWGTVDVTTSDAGVIELDLPPGGAHIVMD